MGGVLSALTPAFALLVALQECAIGMGSVVADKLAEQKEGKDSALSTCKSAIDSIVLCVDSTAKDFPVVLDYATLRGILKTFREALSLSQQALAALSNTLPSLSHSPSTLLQPALQDATRLHTELRQAVEELEGQVEDTKTFTLQVEAQRARLLNRLPDILDHLAVLPQGLKAKRDYEEALERVGEARAAAERESAAELLQEGRRLEGETGSLVQQMDDMLAPFIRITHNIKGKQGKIQESGLTPTEVEVVHKYTRVLLQTELYPRLAAEGGDIEAFLEALFLLGIAGGIGAQPQEAVARHSVLSRKSQAILANALSSFDADNFRACFESWQSQHKRLQALHAQPDYSEQHRKQGEACVRYEEASKGADRAVREWGRFAPSYHSATLGTQHAAKHIQHGCRVELGVAIELHLPQAIQRELK